MTQDDQTPKLHIDSDWKAQAHAEKERLAQQEAEREKSQPAGAAKSGELPPADFRGLIGLLASQAMMGLGMFGDRESGRVMIDLDGSRFNIDLLTVIQEKTKGNLTDEESDELQQVLTELRNRYVQVNQLVAQQMAAQAKSGDTAAASATPAAAAGQHDLRTPESG